jgi:MFS family permease
MIGMPVRPSIAPLSNARRWSVVCLLSVGVLIAYVDRSNLSVALATSDFKALFRLSDQDRGILNSAFFWSYALLQIPAGLLVDRFGVKRPYTIAFLFWSGVSAATALANSITQLLILRVLLGVGESAVTPASMRWIRYNVAEKSRGGALGVYFAGTKFGPAVGAFVAAVLVQRYGWRMMFALLGFGCLVWLIPWQLLVRDDDRELEAAQAVTTAPTGSSVWRSIALWGILIGTFSYNYFVYFSMTWLPAYFVERRGLSLDSMGLYTAFSFSGMAVVAIVAGWIADRIIVRGGDPVRVRKAFTIAGFAVASTEVFGALAKSTEVAVIFAIISLAGLGLATANYWALTQTLMPGAAIGRIAGAQNCASNVSGIAAPLLTGWLKESTGSYAAPMQAIWLFLLIGIGAYAFLVRPKFTPHA